MDKDRGCFEAGLEFAPKQAARFDLHGHAQALLVNGPFKCIEEKGAFNREMLLYMRTGLGWRRILRGFGVSLEACAQADARCFNSNGFKRTSTQSQEWRDLILWSNRSLFARTSGARLIYQFDGNEYKATICNDFEYANAESGERTRNRRLVYVLGTGRRPKSGAVIYIKDPTRVLSLTLRPSRAGSNLNRAYGREGSAGSSRHISSG